MNDKHQPVDLRQDGSRRIGKTGVVGARQVGKSTLAEAVLRGQPGGVARFLDKPATKEAAEADPANFVRHDGLLALQALPDTLIGRAETIELWPLSQGEIDSTPDGFVDAVFAGTAIGWADSSLRKHDYINRVARGGYPEAIRRESPGRRRRFFDSYLSDLVVRDVQQVADIGHVAELRQLLALVAAQASGVLTPERLATELGLSPKTVRHYLSILETVFIVRSVPGWTSGAAIASTHPSAVGGLLEGFVLSELARQLTWSQAQAQLFHYRDRDQNEVDALLETYDGRVVGIEVKSSETPRKDDFRGLRLIQRRLGDRFVGGYVLYCGPESLCFGDQMWALPISALWQTGVT